MVITVHVLSVEHILYAKCVFDIQRKSSSMPPRLNLGLLSS